jgi:hypothetical protein
VVQALAAPSEAEALAVPPEVDRGGASPMRAAPRPGSADAQPLAGSPKRSAPDDDDRKQPGKLPRTTKYDLTKYHCCTGTSSEFFDVFDADNDLCHFNSSDKLLATHLMTEALDVLLGKAPPAPEGFSPALLKRWVQPVRGAWTRFTLRSTLDKEESEDMTSLALAAAAVLRLGRQDSGSSARFLKSFEDIAHEVWNREAEQLGLLLAQMSDAARQQPESRLSELAGPEAVLIMDNRGETGIYVVDLRESPPPPEWLLAVKDEMQRSTVYEHFITDGETEWGPPLLDWVDANILDPANGMVRRVKQGVKLPSAVVILDGD